MSMQKRLFAAMHIEGQFKQMKVNQDKGALRISAILELHYSAVFGLTQDQASPCESLQEAA
jgi:hypothetical protein